MLVFSFLSKKISYIKKKCQSFILNIQSYDPNIVFYLIE
jgi:hypothetical protein